MKVIHGLKIGGLQQKIFNLMLIFILALVGAFAGMQLYQHRQLAQVVETAGLEQQVSIEESSEATMDAVLNTSMTKTTALQAYIADDLFSDVREDVLTLQTFATELFANADSFSPHPFYPPDAANDGIPSVQVQHEAGVDPQDSESLALAANMSEVLLSMFRNSKKLSSCFVATPDGNILFVDDRAGAYFEEDGSVSDFAVTSRPWYLQAVEAGELIFTGVESDAFTEIPGLVCAAPVYRDGELVAVVGADIFLTSVQEYVENSVANGGFLCVVNENGQVLFSPNSEGTFRPALSADAPDLRQSGNAELAGFVTEALSGKTGLQRVTVDGKDYYLSGAPMATVGWTVISAVEASVCRQPTEALLQRYDDINAASLAAYRSGAVRSQRFFFLVTLLLAVLAVTAALALAKRIIRPLEHMTQRINSLREGDLLFEMEDVYRTDDEIEILAEAFASISRKTQNYIRQITEITAEKERIGTELALATRIQADMLPNIYPAFPDRPEFDIYASMDPAREVGGDFYDFFLLDDDHLCMLIADVSGKGVPAALFMMASRIILASNAKMGKTPAEILTDTNAAICQNNREEMFVTVWLGILEISTGKMTAVNAGHEYPAIRHPGGSFSLFRDPHGFVVGGFDGVRYKEYEIQLEPGSRMFLYTDGVPEATDADKKMFGTDRMLEALNQHPDAPLEEMLENMRTAVNGFVRDAEQFDDLTMLALVYNGPEANKK